MELRPYSKKSSAVPSWLQGKMSSGFSKIVVTTATVGVAYFNVGSGGSLNVQSASFDRPNFSADDIYNSVVLAKDIVSTEKNKTTKQIDFIKETFALTDEQLAKILGIQRKTLYNWKEKDHIPREGSRERFFQLYVLSKDWVVLGYPTDKSLLTSHFSESQRLLESLESIDREKTLFVGRYLQRQVEEESNLM